jgi:hypothetical protein
MLGVGRWLGDLWPLFELLILVALAAYTLRHLPPALLLLDTTTVGGDTPAHNYLASHLRDQLLHHGRVVGWASGWWAGFPAFQYYFCLPYLLTALLSLLIPFNVAFKLVSVLGILALPSCTYAAARRMRMPRPAPILAAIAMLPFLFSDAHTMWGVNIFSTMAGMLANSISFPIMVLMIGCACRDARDRRARLSTALLAALMLSSHFFTSIVAALTLAILPLLHRRGARLATLGTLAQSGLLGAALMAWWLIPLIATRAYSVDFGTNWDIHLPDTFPLHALAMIPFMLVAILYGARRHHPEILLLGWMLLAATALFLYGYALTPVFVNVRLWPFMDWALYMLGAIGLGLLVQHRPGRPLLILAAATAAMLTVEWSQQHLPPGIAPVRAWADFNFRGLERRPGYRAYQELLLPLDGTPGRLSGDLAEENNAMGSSRALELVPHHIRKDILEGGLVNSALSSYFAYYIQCETSEGCAGYPTLMQPTGFQLENGTRHLELFNVKHFLARRPSVQAAFRAAPQWSLLRRSDEWELFELNTHEGRHVFIPPLQPLAVQSPHGKEYALEWFYRPELLDQFVIFLQPGQTPPPAASAPPLTDEQFRLLLGAAAARDGDLDEWLHLGPFPLPPHHRADPLAYAPIPEAGLDPREGDRLAGRTWQLLFTRSPIYPANRYDRSANFVTYSLAHIVVPSPRDALLHISHDDGAALVLNDEPVFTENHATPVGDFQTTAVSLHAGRNRLLLKSTQLGGGHYFHLRLTDTNGTPFSDAACIAGTTTPAALPPTTAIPPTRASAITAEHVEPNRIRFTTTAIGEPHIIKCSYFPNWKVRGARAVYYVAPSFMLVYPDQPNVELVFGRTATDHLALAITAIGWIAVLLLTARTRRHPPTP